MSKIEQQILKRRRNNRDKELLAAEEKQTAARHYMTGIKKLLGLAEEAAGIKPTQRVKVKRNLKLKMFEQSDSSQSESEKNPTGENALIRSMQRVKEADKMYERNRLKGEKSEAVVTLFH
jgi:hypothetical protein